MILAAAQAAATAVVLARLGRGRERAEPLMPAVPRGSVSVVVPARDEAARIGPCLAGIADAHEVIVVDDGSTDGTAEIARKAGARVIAGREPPNGWVGKPWALQQGVEAATGDVVVCIDADTRPRAGLLGALERALDDADLVCAGPRFRCDSFGERLLHPSFLATVVYRFGAAGAGGGRIVFNGQCTAVPRERFLDAGGYRDSARYMTDDVALARRLHGLGWRIGFLDGADLVEVDMHDDAVGVWREWGRSFAAADVTPRPWLAADVATVWLTLALPVLRAVGRRPSRLDLLLLAVRFALLAPLRRSYARRGVAYWLSPLADPATAVRFTWSALRPPRRWRGRVYGAGGTAGPPAS